LANGHRRNKGTTQTLSHASGVSREIKRGREDVEKGAEMG
jgi:hypothetical protein